jgi:hypothetical protein
MGALRNKDVLGFYFFWRWGYVVTGSHPDHSLLTGTREEVHLVWLDHFPEKNGWLPSSSLQEDIFDEGLLPPFFQPSDYYNLRAFPGDIKYPEREWAYEGQREWVDRLFVSAGIQSSKKTHATRKQAEPVRGERSTKWLYSFPPS